MCSGNLGADGDSSQLLSWDARLLAPELGAHPWVLVSLQNVTSENCCRVSAAFGVSFRLVPHRPGAGGEGGGAQARTAARELARV